MRYEFKKPGKPFRRRMNARERRNAFRWGLIAPVLGIAAWMSGAEAGKVYGPAIFGVKQETKGEMPVEPKEPNNVYAIENKAVSEVNEPDAPNDLEEIVIAEPNEPKLVEEVIEPVYEPKVVVLDPGHGIENGQNYDPGAVTPSGLTSECDVVYSQALKIKEMLEQKGYEVYLTRTDRENPTFPQRRKIAEDLKEQGREVILVSLHANSFDEKSVHGQEVYYRKGEESKKLAEYILDSVVNAIAKTGIRTNNRGVKQADYRVLRTDVSAVLAEPAFLSHYPGKGIKGDYDILMDDNPDVERGVAEGIDRYFRR